MKPFILQYGEWGDTGFGGRGIVWTDYLEFFTFEEAKKTHEFYSGTRDHWRILELHQL